MRVRIVTSWVGCTFFQGCLSVRRHISVSEGPRVVLNSSEPADVPRPYPFTTPVTSTTFPACWPNGKFPSSFNLVANSCAVYVASGLASFRSVGGVGCFGPGGFGPDGPGGFGFGDGVLAAVVG